MKFWTMVGLLIASAWLGFYVTPFFYGLGIVAIPFVFANNIAKMATKQTITTHNTTKAKVTKTSKAKPMLNKETKSFLKFMVGAIFIVGIIISFDEHNPAIGGISLAFFLVSMFLLADKGEIKPLSDDEFKMFDDDTTKDDILTDPIYSDIMGNVNNSDDFDNYVNNS
jgi:hypothetical protein